MLLYVGVFLLSAASLAFEISLSRIFSVAQFYHFAFMVVSLALLGYGASGTLLSLLEEPIIRRGKQLLPWLGWAFALTCIASYALIVHVPFDSFRIAHDRRQVLVLLLHYLALALPFLASGTVVGLLLAAWPDRAHRVYAANLIGSALGCVLAAVAPTLVGGEGAILFCGALSMVAGSAFRYQSSYASPQSSSQTRSSVIGLAVQATIVLVLLLAAWRTPPFLRVNLSPYKGLSYLLQYPDAELIFQRWNSYSRVEVVSSESIRGLSGSGFSCSHQPPTQRGLTVDGDDVNYVHHVEPGFTDVPYTDCLLGALAYQLRPGARAVVLDPRGGADVVTALAQGASHVTVVEGNPLIVEAVREQGDWAGNLYRDERVRVVTEQGRSFARRVDEAFDVVVLSLNTPQRAVTSGAYSLNEDYRYTVQAFGDYLERVGPNGLLVITRWLQVPPSESIRAFALAVESLKRAGLQPDSHVVALRSYQQMLILVRRGPFTEGELQALRALAEPRAFDLVYLPDLRSSEVNRHNVLSEPDYHRACMDLLDAESARAWYDEYPFDVEPPTDDRPFFAHFFRWKQVPSVLAMLGHTWQPFGGAGYLVLLIVLALALIAAGFVILLPIAVLRRRGGPLRATLTYFALLGLGFLSVEIPLMQRFILFLGSPALAMATVLFAVLLFSGLGSATSHRVSLRTALVLLPLLVGVYAFLLPTLFEASLAAPLGARLAISVAALAPPGFLMGIPLPGGLALLERTAPRLIPWAWAVNGAVSVIASVLAALLALSFGFSTVLLLGAACYVGALLTAMGFRPPPAPVPPCP